jgi:Flp pilus assembly protein TadB
MNGDRKPTSEPNSRADKSRSSAFIQLCIVFFVLGVVLLIMGNLAWIAFLTMGATFLIVGMQKRAKKDQPGETTPD